MFKYFYLMYFLFIFRKCVGLVLYETLGLVWNKKVTYEHIQEPHVQSPSQI